ncbi:protein PTST homolog 2, chloroplastic-like isoform X1 [Cucurbita pepo subsp. pepo]|uniref:protein PTST homolog 2, chloroplastic-like isoform X1 n=1 Tax=Cucurbita pepo subsp. pepo TaxID=3664 RepID=UPI000C9D8FD6|nr:protein PTST homolog 2, chloroplastic-like isoform X1 [Cucurbita pepo subsp. pepo]
MLLFTNVLPTSYFFPTPFGCLSPGVFPSIVFVSRCGGMAATERRCSLLSSKGMFYGCSGFVRRCKDLDREGNFALEAEILEFMESSRNPEAFPSKKDLIEAGREDLVDAIVKKGGWLCLGWNLNDEEDGGIEQLYLEDRESILATHWDSFSEFDSFKSDERQRFAADVSPIASSSTSSSFTSRSQVCYSMPMKRTLNFYDNKMLCQDVNDTNFTNRETVAEHESGIEGMLNRLERERNATFGTGKNGLHPETTAKETVADLQEIPISTPLSAKEGKWNNLGSYLSKNSSPVQINGQGGSVSSEVQGTWSTFKTDLPDGDFKGSEMALSQGRSREVLDVLRYETLGSRGDPTNSNSGEEEMSHNQIQRHIQNLQLELSSVIGSLRSNAFASEKGQSKPSDDLLELSDAFEFQENEILNAKDKLRSIRAKIAVVEGKMALTIIDAQKVVEEKQKRINCARRALQFLRTACVVWPNSAAEVLLVGSFDGWSTQRKMERSSTGVFSLFLKLYPGKYEIKFIVDGQWKIDPLRPIVSSDGYENNLLIVM